MSTPYTADYFIEKFSKIPEEKWITDHFVDAQDESRRCVRGHCGARWDLLTDEDKALRSLFRPHDLCPAATNNWPTEQFPQPTPKARILAALQFIKEKGAK